MYADRVVCARGDCKVGEEEKSRVQWISLKKEYEGARQRGLMGRDLEEILTTSTMRTGAGS